MSTAVIGPMSKEEKKSVMFKFPGAPFSVEGLRYLKR